jgi:hypothetical protein
MCFGCRRLGRLHRTSPGRDRGRSRRRSWDWTGEQVGTVPLREDDRRERSCTCSWWSTRFRSACADRGSLVQDAPAGDSGGGGVHALPVAPEVQRTLGTTTPSHSPKTPPRARNTLVESDYGPRRWAGGLVAQLSWEGAHRRRAPSPILAPGGVADTDSVFRERVLPRGMRRRGALWCVRRQELSRTLIKQF